MSWDEPRTYTTHELRLEDPDSIPEIETAPMGGGFLRRLTDKLVRRARRRDDRVEAAARHLESVMRRSHLALGKPLPPNPGKRGEPGSARLETLNLPQQCRTVCRLAEAPFVQDGMWSSDERCLDCGRRRWWPS